MHMICVVAGHIATMLSRRQGLKLRGAKLLSQAVQIRAWALEPKDLGCGV